jgi:hypothetical protein
MWEFIFSTLWGWWGVAGLTVVICVIVGYLVPSLRLHALGVAGVVLTSASLVTKGARDEAAREKRRREAAVKKAQEDYAKIDARPDTPDDVAKRMRDGSF